MDAKLLAKIKQSVVVAKEAKGFRYSEDVKVAARKLMESGATPTEVALQMKDGL